MLPRCGRVTGVGESTDLGAAVGVQKYGVMLLVIPVR